MVDLNQFLEDDPMLVDALLFCFMGLIQTELTEFVLDWKV